MSIKTLTANCPHCGQAFRAMPELAGRQVICPKCQGRFVVSTSQVRPTAPPRSEPPRAVSPPVPPPPPVQPPPPPQPQNGHQQVAGKFCYTCGKQIHTLAEICPHCGVRQANPMHATVGVPRGGVKTPALVSAIFNIIIGLIWLITGCGIVFAIPMFILCIFEFILFAEADNLPPDRLRGRAQLIGCFEIIVGLVNTPVLICGIIMLINGSKVR